MQPKLDMQDNIIKFIIDVSSLINIYIHFHSNENNAIHFKMEFMGHSLSFVACLPCIYIRHAIIQHRTNLNIGG